MKQVKVIFEFNDEELGENWFNEDNLKTLLYTMNSTGEHLLKVVNCGQADLLVTKSEQKTQSELDGELIDDCFAKLDAKDKANGAVADKYNYAILVLEGMRLIFFEHKDELDVAQDTLLKNGKRLQYYKKDKNGYWIKPDVYE